MSFNRISVNSATPEPQAPTPQPAVRPVTVQPAPASANQTSAPTQSVRTHSQQTLSQGADMNIVNKKTIGIAVASVLVLGVLSGGAAAWLTQSSGTALTPQTTQTTTTGTDSSVKVGSVFGVPDTESFKDDVEGIVVVGGLDGEGSHTLLRLGGESQNVYLTSSVVDLAQFQDMKVRVWGETFKGQKAGWLMDVGRVEVLELNAELPNWYLKTQESSGGGE